MSLSRDNGAPLNEIADVEQAVLDVLTTPIGSRLCRRDYGSELPDLLDAPFNDETIQKIYAATAAALAAFVPQFQLTASSLSRASTQAQGFLTLTGTLTANSDVTISINLPLQ